MSPSDANPFPIEIEPVDITPYAAGNTGVPYVTTLDSGQPGPHVMVMAITHGNEICGAITVDYLLRNDVRPVQGKLTFGFHNHAAYHSFDPADPTASRFVDEDLNRVWGADVLDGERATVATRRAREMR
ncbi:MAG: succinylglutamate desuccinylase/aspartoacylase family protein, partial [Magnetovibrio sp.]|nr:succinylglutamate desuccinylase/aspartoacylase family protein [Magnetovibrio sp.]